MRFVNKTGLLFVDVAAQQAEKLLNPTSEMMIEIALKNDWRYDSGSGLMVFEALLLCQSQTNISVYFPKWKYSAQIGRFDDGEIQINGYKIHNLTPVGMAGLLLHEHAHKAKFHHIDPGWWGRKRANYKTEEKCKYSVPYFMSENVGRWYGR